MELRQITVPTTDEIEGYVSPSIELDGVHLAGWKQIVSGLRSAKIKLANGEIVADSGDALRWIVEATTK